MHGRVFNCELLAPYTTVGGAWVFLIRDRAKVDAWVDGLFEAPPLGAQPEGACSCAVARTRPHASSR